MVEHLGRWKPRAAEPWHACISYREIVSEIYFVYSWETHRYKCQKTKRFEPSTLVWKSKLSDTFEISSPVPKERLCLMKDILTTYDFLAGSTRDFSSAPVAPLFSTADLRIATLDCNLCRASLPVPIPPASGDPQAETLRHHA